MNYEELIKNLKEEDGITLKNFEPVTYKSGYQVASEGKETSSIIEAINIVKEYAGAAGVWLYKGVYYVDKSFRVKTKKEALRIGKENNQISVLKWETMDLIYCNEN